MCFSAWIKAGFDSITKKEGEHEYCKAAGSSCHPPLPQFSLFLILDEHPLGPPLSFPNAWLMVFERTHRQHNSWLSLSPYCFRHCHKSFPCHAEGWQIFCPGQGDQEVQGGFPQPRVAQQWSNRDAKAAWFTGGCRTLGSTEKLRILAPLTRQVIESLFTSIFSSVTWG